MEEGGMPGAASAASAASKKRKQPESSSTKNMPRKKYRYDRVINTQTASEYFIHGEIDVGKFVKAREYEIKALEDALKQSKGASASRAFQEVPRSMRRRTGNHNVTRIPKRLRARGKREVCRLDIRM
jgi:ribonuclease P/MRP protein subunit POP1